MPSLKQIAANRLNALKSTGPRTPEGKARSSMNAFQTGIDARSHTVPGESISQLEALTTDYYHRFDPTTPEQRMLVDTLIDCEWLLRRFRKCEAQIWEQNPIYETTLSKAFRADSDIFVRLQRRIDMTLRNYRNALHELERLQAEPAATDPAPDYPTPCKQTASPENGFVPQPSPELHSEPAPHPPPSGPPLPALLP